MMEPKYVLTVIENSDMIVIIVAADIVSILNLVGLKYVLNVVENSIILVIIVVVDIVSILECKVANRLIIAMSKEK